MIKGFNTGTTGGYLHVNGNNYTPHISPNANNPSTGMIRVNGSNYEVFDGSNWTHTAGPYPDLQKWYHYTMTFNGSNVLFYVNGRLYGTALYTSSPITTSGQPISIGRRWDNTFAQSSYINGDISIINVYDTCLNAAEVAQNFNYHKYTYGLNYTLSS